MHANKNRTERLRHGSPQTQPRLDADLFCWRCYYDNPNGAHYSIATIAAMNPSIGTSPGKVQNCMLPLNKLLASTPGTSFPINARAASPEATCLLEGTSLNTSATTSSFSSGSIEHVEYTSHPPDERLATAFASILTWSR